MFRASIGDVAVQREDCWCLLWWQPENTRRKMSDWRTPEWKERFQGDWRTTSSSLVETKTWAWKEFGDAMEKDWGSRGKVLPRLFSAGTLKLLTLNRENVEGGIPDWLSHPPLTEEEAFERLRGGLAHFSDGKEIIQIQTAMVKTL